MEVKKCIALFIWYFRAELAEVGQKEPDYVALLFVQRGPLPVRISLRTSGEREKY
jgi:hypothetical protein